MPKPNKQSIIITIAATIALLFGVYTLFLYTKQHDNQRVFQFIQEQYDTNPIFSADKITPITNGYSGLTEFSNKQEVVLTSFSYTQPVYSLVINYEAIPESNNIAYQDVRVIYTKSNWRGELTIQDYRKNRIDNLSFQQAKELASKYDITTNFSNKNEYNITNYPPLSKEDIEQNQSRSEAARKRQQVEEAFNADTPEGRYELCKDDVRELEELIDATKRGEKTYEAKRVTVQVDPSQLEAYEKELEMTKECLLYPPN